MIKYMDDCCGCATPAFPCMGSSCGMHNVPHWFCDNCEDETDIYNLDGEELCEDCMIKELVSVMDKVECDECGEEDDLYSYDGKALCIECIKEECGRIGE